MRRKHLKWVCLLSVATMLLGGCGGASTDSTESNDSAAKKTHSDDGVVDLVVWGASDDADLLKTIASNFEKENSGTKFNITVEACEESSARETILGDVLNAADVFQFADDQLSSYAAAGVLKPIENQEDIKKRNSESSVEAATLNGQLYAYPLTADNGYFMYYNKKYFQDSDLQTLDGMMAVAAAAGKCVTMDMSSGWYLYSFYGNTGLEVGLNEDGISNYCTWNSTEGAIKGVDVANALIAISQNPGFKSAGDDILSAGAANDTVAAGVSGVWLATSMEEAWGDNYGAVKLPTYTVKDTQVQMSSYAGYKMVGVNSYSEEKEWAEKFAEYMTNETNQTLRFEMRGQGPSNINAAGSDAVAQSPALLALIAQSEFSSLQRIGANYWGPAGELGGNLAGGKIPGDAQDYLDTIVEQITAAN